MYFLFVVSPVQLFTANYEYLVCFLIKLCVCFSLFCCLSFVNLFVFALVCFVV